MRRVALGFIVSPTLTLLVAPGVAEAQEAERRVRVGWLGSGHDVNPVGFEQFREGLRGYGFAATFEVRYAYGHVDRLPRLAAELVGQKKVEILLMRDSPAAHAANDNLVACSPATPGRPGATSSRWLLTRASRPACA